MKSVGFRVTPNATIYAVVQPTEDGVYEVTSSESIKHPSAMNEPQKLAHLRTTVLDLLSSNKAKLGGIKVIENNSQNKDAFRLNCEGVIQETFASASLDGYFFGTIPALTGVFGFQDKKYVKALLKGDADPDFCDWGSLKADGKEAVLAAIAALKQYGH